VEHHGLPGGEAIACHADGGPHAGRSWPQREHRQLEERGPRGLATGLARSGQRVPALGGRVDRAAQGEGPAGGGGPVEHRGGTVSAPDDHRLAGTKARAREGYGLPYCSIGGVDQQSSRTG